MDERILYEKAVSLFGEGRKEDAVQALLEIIRRFPDFVDAYETIGMVYYKMNRLDEAVVWTKRLAELKPEHAMAHTNLSIFYMKKGMKEKAEEEKAIATVLNFAKPK